MKIVSLITFILCAGILYGQNQHFSKFTGKKSHLSMHLDSLRFGDTAYLQIGAYKDYPENHLNVRFSKNNTFEKVRFISVSKHKGKRNVMYRAMQLTPSGNWKINDDSVTIQYKDELWHLKIIASQKKKITFVLIE